jgi:hypothetical protein
MVDLEGKESKPKSTQVESGGVERQNFSVFQWVQENLPGKKVR